MPPIRPRALLLDLDDTLLHNDMEDFLPTYFSALMERASELMAPQEFLRALHYATQRMMASTDLSRSNEEVFWHEFEPSLPVPREQMEPLLSQFYEVQFETLRGQTDPVEGAVELVEAAKEAGWKVAIATNPVFPMRAMEHRLSWAGVPREAVDYITAYENMRSTKPHASYFEQIARELEVAPEDAVMAGNHLSNDLVGAAEIGMRTFWVDTYPIDDAELDPDARGSLVDLRRWLFDG